MSQTLTITIVVALCLAAFFVVKTRSRSSRDDFVASPDHVTLRASTSGKLLGYKGRKGAFIWEGVPYAAPPVGQLRWRAPQPLRAPILDSVVVTTAPGAACSQLPSLLSGEPNPGSIVHGYEDCLYLNIYAPPEGENLPVMYWIHGGGNSIGTASTYSGEQLAMKYNVVVVAINYRLGVFGWFKHPALSGNNEEDNSGNYGTLDTIHGLKWVRDNISAFGGDPGNVTVFGESAGAFNTLAIIASPLAKGLFHRAAVQSGGLSLASIEQAQNHVEDGGHAFSSQEIIKKLLLADGTVTSAEAATAYLRDIGEADLRDYLYQQTPDAFLASLKAFSYGMVRLPGITADGYVLPKLSAHEIFSDPNNHNQVPTILGTNRDEPSLFLLTNPDYVSQLFGVLPKVKDAAVFKRAVNYGALSWKLYGVDQIARDMIQSGNADVYAYRFDWDEESSNFFLSLLGSDIGKILGASHGLEIPFVFSNFDSGVGSNPIFPDDQGQAQLSDAMSSYWAEFAYNGNPGQGRGQDHPRWQSWGSDNKYSLIFDTPQDQGIFMSDTQVTVESLKAKLAADKSITEDLERCEIYMRIFQPEDFDKAELMAMGAKNCPGLELVPKDLI